MACGCSCSSGRTVITGDVVMDVTARVKEALCGGK